MAVSIAYERKRSVGGSYRRYVEIEYVNITLYNNQIDENNDEL